MRILDLLTYKFKEREMANAYRECCKQLYDEYEWYKKYICDSDRFVPGRYSVILSRSAVYRCFRYLKEIGFNPKDVLLKTVREMDSKEENIVLFEGILDLEDFKPSSKRVAIFDRKMMFVKFMDLK